MEIWKFEIMVNPLQEDHPVVYIVLTLGVGEVLVRDGHGRRRQAVRVEGGGSQQVVVGAPRDGNGVRGRLSTTGKRFNRKTIFGLSFGLKNGWRFHFNSETCLNYPFLNIFSV